MKQDPPKSNAESTTRTNRQT